MRFLGTGRGQALQVGAILLFGMLIVFLALYQATAIPAENERVEFTSFVEASTDVERLRADVQYVASRDTSTGTTIQTGVQYPARVLFVNPGPTANRLRTGDSATIGVANASAVASEAAATRTVWDGTTHTVATRPVRLDTAYNELQVPDVVYESGVVYRPTNESVSPPYGPGEAIPLTDQSLVDGDRITLVGVRGELSAGGPEAIVEARPVSSHTRTVVVEDGGGNVTLTVPSDLSAATWEQVLLGDEPAVQDVIQNGSSAVDVVLRPGTYQLRLAQVEVRRQADASTVADTTPAYLLGVEGDGSVVSLDQRARLTAEVRDRFNNPKSGVDVRFESQNGTFAAGGSSTILPTDGEGRAGVLFEPDSTGDAEVTAGMDTDDDGSLADEAARNRTTFTVQVSAAQGLGGTSDPATSSGDASGVVVLQRIDPTTPSGSGFQSVTFTVNNTATQDVNVTGVRLGYMTVWDNNAAIQDGPDEATVFEVATPSTGFSATRNVNVVESESPVFFADDVPLEPEAESELTVHLDQTYSLQNKQAATVSVTVYFDGGLAAEYSVYLFNG